MEIPTGWNHLETEGYVQDATAFYHTPDFTIQVTHVTRNTTKFHVREGWVESFDFQDRDKIVDFGFHNTPADAFRFAEAYIADGGSDYRRSAPMHTSPRYSRAVSAAYSR